MRYKIVHDLIPVSPKSNTGLLIDPQSGMLVDPQSGQMIDPNTMQPVPQQPAAAPAAGGAAPPPGPAPAAGAPPQDPNAMAQDPNAQPAPSPEGMDQMVMELANGLEQMASAIEQQQGVIAELQQRLDDGEAVMTQMAEGIQIIRQNLEV